jgi:hypothetical protein
VDFKAGIEDASRGVITSLDWVLVVMDPSHAGLRAAVTMKTLLDQMHGGSVPATRHLESPELVALTLRNYREARTQGALYVLNKVPDPDTEHFLWQRLLAEEINVVASIHDDSPLRQAWLEGKPLRSPTARRKRLRSSARWNKNGGLSLPNEWRCHEQEQRRKGIIYGQRHGNRGPSLGQTGRAGGVGNGGRNENAQRDLRR